MHGARSKIQGDKTVQVNKSKTTNNGVRDLLQSNSKLVRVTEGDFFL